MTYTVDVTLESATKERTVGRNNTRLRTFVGKTIDQYPEILEFQLFSDRCSLLNGFRKGDRVKVGFRLGGRVWEKDERKRVIISLTAIAISKIGEAEPEPDAFEAEPAPVEDEELPF